MLLKLHTRVQHWVTLEQQGQLTPLLTSKWVQVYKFGTRPTQVAISTFHGSFKKHYV